MITIPRFRGRVGQAFEPEEFKGKWFFEVLVSDMDLESGEGHSCGQFGPYETEEEAQKNLQDAVKMVAQSWEKQNFGKISGKYWDVKDGKEVLRKWSDL